MNQWDLSSSWSLIIGLTASWAVLLPDCWGFPGSWAQWHRVSYPLTHRTDAGMSCMEHTIRKQLCHEKSSVSTGRGVDGKRPWWNDENQSKSVAENCSSLACGCWEFTWKCAFSLRRNQIITQTYFCKAHKMPDYANNSCLHKNITWKMAEKINLLSISFPANQYSLY